MLALRCLCNLFRDPTSVYVLREKYKVVIETVSPHLKNAKNTIREGAVTFMLNLSIIQLQKENHEMRMAILSALGSLANETDEQCKKRLQAAVSNLTYKNYEAKKLAKEMGILPE